MQQFCKHDTAAKNRGTIQEGVHYSVGHEIIKGKLQTVQVQFAPVHDKDSLVYVLQSCKVNNCSLAKERPYKQSVKQALY
jgi:hypothetical protein